MKRAKTKTAEKVEVRRANKDAKGRWVKGCEPPNPLGRPPGKGTKLDALLMSITRVEAVLGKNLLDHYVKTAFKDNTVLISIMKKLCPDLKALEVIPGVGESMSDEAAEIIRKKLAERMSRNNET